MFADVRSDVRGRTREHTPIRGVRCSASMFGFGMHEPCPSFDPFPATRITRASDPRRTIVRPWKSSLSPLPGWRHAHEATTATLDAGVRRIRVHSGSRRRTVAWNAPRSAAALVLFPHPETGSAPTRPGSPHKPLESSRGSVRCVAMGTPSAIRIVPGASRASDGDTRRRKIGNEPTRPRSLFIKTAASMRPGRP